MRMRRAAVGVVLGLIGCATGGGGSGNDIKQRANLAPADFCPLGPGWKWAYDVEKDGMTILAAYSVIERVGDTAVIQAGDERLTYAVTPEGIAQKEAGTLGDYIIKGPLR